MSIPEGSHGTTVFMERDPTGNPGVFTLIGKLQDVSFPGLSRAQTLSSGQEDLISTFVSSSLLMVGSVDLTVWFSSLEDTHTAEPFDAIGPPTDKDGGVYSAIILNELRQFEFRGPSEAADIFAISAHISEVGKSAPVNEGVYEMTFSIQASGSITIEGETVSNP